MKKILGLALGITMISLTPAVGNAADKIEFKCGKEVNLSIEPTGGTYKVDKDEFEIRFCERSKMIWIEADRDILLFRIGYSDQTKIEKIDYYYKNGDFKNMEKRFCTIKNGHLIKSVKKAREPEDVSKKIKLLNDRISCLQSTSFQQEDDINGLEETIERLKKKNSLR